LPCKAREENLTYNEVVCLEVFISKKEVFISKVRLLEVKQNEVMKFCLTKGQVLPIFSNFL
jgi:hypothetical protein